MSKICDFCGQEYFGSGTAHVEVCPEPRKLVILPLPGPEEE